MFPSTSKPEVLRTLRTKAKLVHSLHKADTPARETYLLPIFLYQNSAFLSWRNKSLLPSCYLYHQRSSSYILYRFCVCVHGKIHIKFAILTIKYTLQWHQYITLLYSNHRYSPPEPFHLSIKQELFILFFPSARQCHHSFCLYKFDCSSYFIKIESYNIHPLVNGLYHLA